mmetsp:Transcript_50177/g.113795  ORF Transcript_50177/g.113795 Transcript_50177/m.113795 type:complete len:1229 (-) Transcript_50177:778-4464(-)
MRMLPSLLTSVAGTTILKLGYCGTKFLSWTYCVSPELAVSSINAGQVKRLEGAEYSENGTLTDFQIELVQREHNADKADGLMIISDFARDGFNAVLGCGYSSVTVDAATYGRASETVMIGYSATSPALSNKQLYSYFLRLCTPDSAQAAVFTDVLEANDWHQFAFLSTSDAYAQGLADYVAQLETERTALQLKGTFQSMEFAADFTDKEVRRQKWGPAVSKLVKTRAKIWLICVAAELTEKFYEFLAEEYAFLFGPEYVRVTCETFAMAQALVQSVVQSNQISTLGDFNVEPKSDSPVFDAFVDRYKASSLDEFGDFCKCSPDEVAAGKCMNPGQSFLTNGEGVSGAYMDSIFDAVFSFAQASLNIMKRDAGLAVGDIKGKVLLDEILGLEFLGATGAVSFDEYQDNYGGYCVNQADEDFNQICVWRWMGTLQPVHELQFKPFDGPKTASGAPSDEPQCIAGSMRVVIDGALQCIECRAGTFSSSVNAPACTPCAAGSVAPMDGAEECSPCALGSFGFNSTHCQRCDPGTFASSVGRLVCEPCPAGSISSGGASSCSLCEAGSYTAAKGFSECLPCSAGFFQGSEGATSCDFCPAGTFSDTPGQPGCTACGLANGGTGGMIGVAHGQFCVCDPGFYFRCRDGESNSRCILNSGANVTCEPCPSAKTGSVVLRGLDCAGGYESRAGMSGSIEDLSSLQHAQPVNLPGFMSLVESPYESWGCRNERQCFGGVPGVCGPAGRDGNVQGCTTCVDGMFGIGDDCSDCSGSREWLMIALPICFFFSIPAMYYFCNSPVTANVGSMLATTMAFGMIVMILQVFGVFSRVTLRLDSPMKEIMMFMRIFNFDIDMLGAECLLDTSALSKFTNRCLLPLLLCFMYVAWWGGSRLLSWKNWAVPETCNAMGLLLQALFITMITITTEPFQCKLQPTGKTSLVGYPEITCGEGDHTGMLALGVIFTVAYGVGLFAVALWATLVAPKRSAVSPVFLVMFRFLFFRFRADRWYWGSALLLRNGFLSFVPVMTPDDAHAQIVLFSTVLLVALVSQVALWPWKNLQLNIVDCVLIVLVTTIVSCSAVTAPPSPNEGTFTVFMVLLFVVALLVALAPTCHGVYLMATKADSKPLKIPDEKMRQIRDTCGAWAALSNEETKQLMIQIGPFGRTAMYRFSDMLAHELGVRTGGAPSSRLTLQGTRQSSLRKKNLNTSSADVAASQQQRDAGALHGGGSDAPATVAL